MTAPQPSSLGPLLLCLAAIVALTTWGVTARGGRPMILDDANHPAVERGRYVIGYIELVDGYRHAYRKTSPRGFRSWIAYSRSANHPPDPRCPECNPTPSVSLDGHEHASDKETTQ